MRCVSRGHDCMQTSHHREREMPTPAAVMSDIGISERTELSALKIEWRGPSADLSRQSWRSGACAARLRYDNLSKPSPKPLRLIGKPMPSSGV